MSSNSKYTQVKQKSVYNILRGQNIGLYRFLSLESKNITTLKGIEEYPTIEELRLNNNFIKDLSPLSYLTNLRVLELKNNHIKSIKPLNNLKHLKKLNLENNTISKAKELEKLSNLTYLNLGKNSITNIKDIPSNPNLLDLNLSYNHISSIKKIYHFPKLIHFIVHDNSIYSLDGLQSISSLRSIHASDCNLTSLQPIIKLKKLNNLFVDRNQISDISPISEFNSLIHLGLENNLISDISPLKNMKIKQSLNLSRNNISSLRYFESIIQNSPNINFRVGNNPFNSLKGISYRVLTHRTMIFNSPVTFRYKFPNYVQINVEEYLKIVSEQIELMRNHQYEGDEAEYRREEKESILKRIVGFYQKSLQSLINMILNGEMPSEDEIERLAFETPMSMREFLENNISSHHPLFKHPKWEKFTETNGNYIIHR